jgi:hypothetical protein
VELKLKNKNYQIWRRTGFYYEAFLFTSICVLFIIGLNYFVVFAPREWTDTFYAYIQSFVVKYFSWFIDLMMK